MMQVLFLARVPTLAIQDSRVLAELAELVDRSNRQAIYRGGLPIPAAAPFVAAARHVVALAALVPVAEPSRAPDPLDGGHWVSTTDAAKALSITDRAIRKRLQTGTLHGRRVAGRWWIDVRDLDAAS